jgi:hypothetical protein
MGVSVFGEDIADGIGPVGIGRDGRDDADDDESPEQALRRIVSDLASGDDLWASPAGMAGSGATRRYAGLGRAGSCMWSARA